jgi:putative effector of murein hydrolase
MNALSLFCLVWTIVLYFVLKAVHRRYTRIWLSPGILVPILTIGLMVAAGIPYDAYMADSRGIVWLLGPASVAFAIPIYEYRAVARRHWLALSLGVVVGMLVGMISSLLLAQAFHFNQEVSRSLMARSITTPFAIALADHIGGSRELVSLFTVITGVVGMLAGDLVLAVLRLRSPLAQGASLGAAAHGFGTALARQRDTEEGVVASLTMMLSGVLMVLAGPFLTNCVIAIFGS